MLANPQGGETFPSLHHLCVIASLSAPDCTGDEWIALFLRHFVRFAAWTSGNMPRARLDNSASRWHHGLNPVRTAAAIG